MRKLAFAHAVTAQLISAFVFPTHIVQILFYLNPKFQVCSPFLRLLQMGLCQNLSETLFSRVMAPILCIS